MKVSNGEIFTAHI